MNLSITLQAHPHRREMAEELAHRAGATITWDPIPADPHPSAWRTYRHALETTPPETTHRLIVQDDAAVCQHFAATAAAAVEACPPGLLCLFVQGSLYHHVDAINRACAESRSLTILPPGSWVPAVATCWPAETIPRALAWVDQQGWPTGFNADDEIIGRLTRGLLIDVYATVPSLVDHPDDVVSIVGSRTPMFGGNPDRVAHCYVGDDADPRGIEWRI